jgi:glutamate 5-kinase
LLFGDDGFHGMFLEDIVKQMARVKRERDINLLVVSSGAMGCGMDVLGTTKRPVLLPEKQAVAAVGQSRLMHFYEALFQTYGDGLKAAQVLVSARDLDDRGSYLNLRNTLNALFAFGNVVPVLNENDSTATHEIKFGDNDTLSAKVASKVGADLLLILSNVDGLYEEDPGTNPNAKLLEHIENVTPEIETLARDTRTQTSIGGMTTKLAAAKIACASGLPCVIANGHRSNVIEDVLNGTGQMTVFGANENGISHRKRWIAFGRSARGVLRIDDGARNALMNKGTSLLAAGIVSVDGDFEIGDAVSIMDGNGKDIARGLVNYRRSDLDRIKGKRSGEIEGILGSKDFDEVVHRDNLVIL